MQTALDEEYLTVGQAADLLHVNKSTIRRWIAQELLPAYRVGQRRVAIKRSDVARLITPTRRVQAEKGGAMAQREIEQIRKLTTEEQQRGLEAVEALKRLQQELDAKYGRRLQTPSWELLNEARDERGRQLR